MTTEPHEKRGYRAWLSTQKAMAIQMRRNGESIRKIAETLDRREVEVRSAMNRWRVRLPEKLSATMPAL